MKILAVCASRDVGGEQTLLADFGRQFLRQGVDWQVACLDPSGDMRRFYQSRGLPAHQLREQPQALKAFFMKNRPDLIETSHLFAGPIAQAAHQSHIPFVWKVVVDPKQFWSERSWQPHRAAIQKGVSHVVVLSNRFIPAMRGFSRSKMSVVPAAVDPTEFSMERLRPFRGKFRAKFRLSERTFAVGMPANFTPRKRHGDFILAALKVHAILPRARFFLFGNAFREVSSTYRYRRMVRRLIRSSGAGRFIRVHPQISPFQWIVAGLDLFVLPSEGEGHSRAILEAMAARLPVIAARSGATPDLIRPNKTGMLVPPRKPDDLARSILALRKSARRSRMGREAQKSVCRDFDIRILARRKIQLYRRIIRES